MKSSDKTIVVGVGVLVLTIVFYFMVLGPKRERAAELSEEVSSLEGSIQQQEQIAAFAEEARQEYPTYYGRLVVLGKAVPEGADSASMLVQLNTIANRDNVEFLGIKLSQSASGTGTSSASAAPAAAAAASTAAPAEGTEGSAPTDGSTTTTGTEGDAAAGAATGAGSTAVATPAAATEAVASSLPIGAVVGPAGLPTLPYEIVLEGGFFDLADYFGGLDDLVQMREQSGQVSVDGRLLTVDGWALKGGRPGSDPILTGRLKVTTYTTPSTQGMLAGASPSGPAPAPAAPTTPASSVTP